MFAGKRYVVTFSALCLTLGVAVAAGAVGEGADRPQPRAAPAVGAASPSESGFVALTPCRLVDTRLAGGPVVANTTRDFKVRGTGPDFAAQGGRPNGCGIPDQSQGAAQEEVDAVEITVTAVSPTGNGFLRVFPFGQPVPNATFLNYSSSFNIGNTGTVALCTASCTKDLSIKPFFATTDVVIDVFGYYVRPLFAVVNADGSLARGSGAAFSNKLSTFPEGEYFVTFFRQDLGGCAFVATVGPPGFTGSPSPAEQGEATVSRLRVQASDVPNGVRVQTADSDGTPADHPFHLDVRC